MTPDYHFEDIPPDRQDGSSSWVHTALIVTGRLGRLRPWLLFPLWTALAWVTGLTWPRFELAARILTAGFILTDWTLLAALPLTRRSWGPVTPPLLGLALVHTFIGLTAGLLPGGQVSLGVAALANLALSVVAWYATWIEPFRIEVSHERLHVAGWSGDQALRCLHISDIHFERWSRREDALLALVTDLQPDIIFLTGDYLNLSSVTDPEAQAGARALLARLEAPLGIYGVTGSPVVDRADIVPACFAGLPIRWLEDEVAPLSVADPAGRHVWVLGVRTTYDVARDEAALQRVVAGSPAGALRILLTHTPDLAPAAAAAGLDLYLCGHTHGGQIRAPLYGAIATSSRYGKRYEQGRIREDDLTIYVSRGLGLEGLGAPRARFLAPPEITVWEIGDHGR